MEKALVTRIVRDSIVDGPGCRYVVFLKGCHLRCRWCHNPETQETKNEILFYEKFCINCGACKKAAGKEGDENFSPAFFRGKSGDEYPGVVDACPTNALSYAAREYDSDWLLDDIEKYRMMYRETGGGVTLSGGEPLLQTDFVLEVFSRCRDKGLHTAADTCGAVDWKKIAPLLSVTDLWLYDLKHLNDDEVLSSKALANLKRLDEVDAKIWIRIPLVPGYNCIDSQLESMADYLKQFRNVEQIFLLPFHPFAASKYGALGKTYEMAAEPLSDENKQMAYDIFRKQFDESTLMMGKTIVTG